MFAGDGQGLELAGLHLGSEVEMLSNIRETSPPNRATTAAAAFVGDVQHVGAGAVLEDLGGQVAGVAVAGGGEAELAGMLPGVGDEFGDAVGGGGQRGRDQHGQGRDQRDRGEVAPGIVGQRG